MDSDEQPMTWRSGMENLGFVMNSASCFVFFPPSRSLFSSFPFTLMTHVNKRIFDSQSWTRWKRHNKHFATLCTPSHFLFIMPHDLQVLSLYIEREKEAPDFSTYHLIWLPCTSSLSVIFSRMRVEENPNVCLKSKFRRRESSVVTKV